MARLPVRGSALATPLENEAALRTVLVKLCPGADFSKLDIEECHRRLGRMLGQWSSERDRLDISALVKTLTTTRKSLERIAKLLSAQDHGIQHMPDVQVVLDLRAILALDPEVGSHKQANRLIASFRRDAAKLAHAFLINAHELKQQVGQSGRPRSDWYDDFTALLLEIAEAAGVKPRFIKDRVSGERVGWLVDAAEALEAFLDPDMHSPSKEARGKRLERSLKALKQLHRQNPSSA